MENPDAEYEGPSEVGQLMWRKASQPGEPRGASDLRVMFQLGRWWIGNIHDATADYYVLPKDESDRARPPLTGAGEAANPWRPCCEVRKQNPWSLGRAPAPAVEAMPKDQTRLPTG